MNKFYLPLVCLVGFGIGLYYLITFSFYPVAIVNYKLIGAKSFEEATVSAFHYYDQALKTYNISVPQNDLKDAALELRRAILDKMVQDALVSNELEDKVGSELAGIVENKIGQLKIKSPDFSSAVSTLYGLTVDRFKAIVLVPQARQEILEGRIILEKSNYNEWLKNARNNAKVTILVPDLKWDGEKVVIK